MIGKGAFGRNDRVLLLLKAPFWLLEGMYDNRSKNECGSL